MKRDISSLIAEYKNKKAQADVVLAEAKLLMTEIEAFFSNEIEATFDLREKPYGTTFFNFGDDKVTVTRAKDVKWDKEKLLQKYDQVKGSDTININDVFRIDISVDERFFEKANKEIKDFFEDARTVSHKPAKLTFSKRGEE